MSDENGQENEQENGPAMSMNVFGLSSPTLEWVKRDTERQVGRLDAQRLNFLEAMEADLEEAHGRR